MMSFKHFCIINPKYKIQHQKFAVKMKDDKIPIQINLRIHLFNKNVYCVKFNYEIMNIFV